MTTVIAVANLKGGAGKTTVAVSLAGEIVRRGRQVVLVDADPQQSATMWARQGGEAFPAQVAPAAAASGKAGANRFRSAIEAAAGAVGRQGVVVIDCPPELADATLLACLLADVVLVPTTPSPLDLWAAEKAVEAVHEARATRQQRGKPRCWLVPSRVARTTAMGRDLPAALERLGEPVAPGLALRIAHAEAAVAGTSIDRYAPNSAAHADVQALVDAVVGSR